jgi:transcriptional regulator with PAS, ATPase and Fis domain/tetratricopeptide (TPR) repeat protein
MEAVENILHLTRVGRFGQALQAFEEAKLPSSGRSAAEVLKAQVLEQVGHADRALDLATTLLQSKTLTISQRSECEAVVGKILFEEGHAESGLSHLQRAALAAQQTTDLTTMFGAKLFMFVILSERAGPMAGASILADLRRIATKLGDHEVTARLHLFVAQAEAKRGLLENATRHTALARRILRTSSNVYLAAFVANLDLAIAVLRCEFDVAKNCGLRAVEFAEKSGVGKIRKAVFGNLGNLYCEMGDFDRATGYFENALAILPANGANTTAVLESLARVHLRQGRTDACLSVLNRIESSIRVEQDRLSYEQRYSALTRVHLLAQEGHIEQALLGTGPVLELAALAGDGLLQKQTQLTRADLLQRLGQIPSSMALISEVVPGLAGLSPELYARSEQILACALGSGGCEDGQLHYDRAYRVYRSVGSVPKLRELEVCWNQTRAVQANGIVLGRAQTVADRPEAHGVRIALHGIAAAFTHAARPDLVARELLEVLVVAGCIDTARATIQAQSGRQEIICESNSDSDPSVAERRLSVGFSGDREVQLHVRPKSNVESVASINAVTLLLASLHEVQRSRAEREERTTLWPIEELPDSEGSVVAGRMRELMEYSRRIARTKVNVLITGESGTGKEILARAIHDFSDRAGKPFVPFNCTAIPRDLLESQLFGHRRGAFTGADRDQLGLIRAAREGTLFLDEIGELGLDLQPKLLRFLESGEIAPLGEPGSITIDVRIVAATNANLEDAVRAGRFREDLFYRLNVVRLSIPPLRERRDEIPGFVNHFVTRAAGEFKKGQLRVAEETMERLLLYRWPGNVRQLQNEMRRMVALAEPDSTLLPDAISEDILNALPIFRHPSSGEEIAVDLHDKLIPTITRIEAEMIKAALRRHDGKVEAVAKALGISRKGLYLKRQRLGL